MNKNKIGVGIMSYNSPEYFKTLYDSIPFDKIGGLVVINGGNPYEGDYPNCVWIQHETNKFPSVCRNEALDFLIGQQFEHIFLIEDDMEILDPEIFDKYIETSQKTGLKYLCHVSTSEGSGERFKRTPKKIVEYPNGAKVAFYPNMCNEFTYHHISAFYALSAKGEKTFYDENMRDAFDVELTYRESLMPHAAPFWHFADIVNSDQYIRNNPVALSRLQANGARANTIAKVWEYFKNKHGISVGEIPHVSDEEFKNKMKKIYETRKLPRYDIFIPCIDKDWFKLPYVITSCLKHLKPDNIYICSPKLDVLGVTDLINRFPLENLSFLHDEYIIPNCESLKQNITFRSNWIFQQFLKLCQNVTPNDYFLSVDADTIFCKDLQMFGLNDKPNWFYGWEQHHQPYYDFMKNEFGIEKVLPHTGIGDIGFFDKRIVRKWMNGSTVEEMLMQLGNKMTPNYHFSEFETYANFAYGNYNYVKLDQKSFGKRLDLGEDWTETEINKKVVEFDGHCETLQLHSWKV
jgi:hypothetical protein